MIFMKNATIIIGGAWGDEGKGKVASREAKDAFLDIRATGGANAGHTIVFNGQKLPLHLIPGGIVYPQTTALIGQGVVFAPDIFLDEIDLLKDAGIPFVKKRIRISGKAHVILPHHKGMDLFQEKMKENPIGTTMRGIGPCYEDKKARVGLQVYDLFLPVSALEEKIYEATKIPYILFHWAGLDDYIISPHEIAEKYHEYAVEIGYDNVISGDILVNEVCQNNHKIVVEGAQAYRLDNDYGDYPYVTSSNCVTAGTMLGGHLTHKCVDKVIVVAKAYCSRVGNGVFPTELLGDEEEEGELIRKIGHEYGTTTGRPRRTGWGDAVLLRSACLPTVTGADYLCINHIDSLGEIGNKLGYVKLCTAYRYESEKKIHYFPDDINLTGKCPTPVYQVFKGGWEIPHSLRNYDELPETAKQYIETIEHIVGIPVKYIGVGPDNDDMIVREDV